MLSAPLCGTTPLHDAVGNNHHQVVELLVRTGGQCLVIVCLSGPQLLMFFCPSVASVARIFVVSQNLGARKLGGEYKI